MDRIPEKLMKAIGAVFVSASMSIDPGVKLSETRTLIMLMRSAATIINDIKVLQKLTELEGIWVNAMERYKPENKDSAIDGWRLSVHLCNQVLDDCSFYIFNPAMSYGIIPSDSFSLDKSIETDSTTKLVMP
jgi:hypothetical protein